MLVKTLEEKDDVKDLEETFESIRKFDTRLSPKSARLGYKLEILWVSC